jgi:ATP-dependent RNA helicase DHX8/PRP22
MGDILNDLEKLEKLSLVSKVCTELENHLGLNDKDLAEFIIHLAEKNDTFDKFKSVLIETSGDSFPDSFIANLLRIIQRMNPSMRQQPTQTANNTMSTGPVTGSNFKTIDPGVKKVLCPALALPNERIAQKEASSSDNDREEEEKEEKKEKHKETKSHHHNHHKKSKKSSTKSRRRSRSRSEDRSSRSRSRSRTPPRKQQRNRDRSRSPDTHNSSSHSSSKRSGDHSLREDERSRKFDKYSGGSSVAMGKEPTEPVAGDIYDGIVSSLMQFGCFVQLNSFRKKTEGLVHISNLREEGRVSVVADVVSRHQKVKVKVLSCLGTKISLSMKEVDQFTGKDLNPANTKRLKQATTSYGSGSGGQSSLYGEGAAAARNPDRPDSVYDSAPVNEDDDDSKVNVKVKNKQISDFEKWELQQLRNANAIQLTDMPYFDEENGILQNEEEEEIQDIEIELVEDECVFLKGYGMIFFNFKFSP